MISTNKISQEVFSQSPYQQLDDLITQIYQGFLEDSPWKSFMKCLLQRTNSDFSVLLIMSSLSDMPPKLFCSAADVVAPESQAYLPEAVFENSLLELAFRTGDACILDQAIDQKTLANTDLYQMGMKPYGIEHVAVIDITAVGGTNCLLGVMRKAEKSNFGALDTALLTTLKRHLAFALQRYLDHESNEVEKRLHREILKNLGFGAVTLDVKGNVLEINEPAKSIFEESGIIKIIDSRLVVATKAFQHQAFNDMLRSAIKAGKKNKFYVEACRLYGVGPTEIGVLVRTFPSTSAPLVDSVPAVVVYLDAFSEKHTTSSALVAKLFMLTKSEARLATMLASGTTLTDAAVKLNLTEHSVRTYSKRIFAKVGVGRQAELALMITKSVAALAPAH